MLHSGDGRTWRGRGAAVLLAAGLAGLSVASAAAEPSAKARRIDLAASRTARVPAQRAEGAAATAPQPAATERDVVTVQIDNAKVIRLPERAQTVIVGNPMIADVTTQRNGVLVVTGKTYGATNLIALDGAGNLLAESMIRVQAPNDAIVTVQRGLERESYSCTPNCQPSLLLGDAQKYFSDLGGQAGQRNTLATQR